MVKKARLQKSYEREGLAGITWRQLDMLKAIEARSIQFRTFFKSLAKEYPKTSGLSNQINEALAMTEDVVSTLGGLQGRTHRPVSSKEIEELLSSIQIVSEIASGLADRRVESVAFDKKLSEVEVQSGFTVKDISETSKGMRREVAGMGRRKRGALGKALAPATGLAKDLAGGAATALLGPFAGVLGTLGKSAMGIVGGIGRGLLARRRGKFLKGLGPAAQRLPERWLGDTQGERMRGRGLQGFYPRGALGDMPAFRSIFGGDTRGTVPRVGGTLGGFGAGLAAEPSKKQIITMSLPLSYFFGKPAYKAGWTQEVVVLLRKIAKVSGKGKEGSTNVFVTGMLPGILSGLGVTLGATAIAAFSKWQWDKRGGVKTLTPDVVAQAAGGMGSGFLGWAGKMGVLQGSEWGRALGEKLPWLPKYTRKEGLGVKSQARLAGVTRIQDEAAIGLPESVGPTDSFGRKTLETVPIRATESTSVGLFSPLLEKFQKVTSTMLETLKDLRPKENAIAKTQTSEYYREKDRILDRVAGQGLALDD